MKVTGTWHGQYTYGPGYGAPLAGTSVPFALSLTHSWLGRVTGYVRDDAAKGGMPERGRIVGKTRGTRFEFVKTMPVSYVADESGTMVEKRSWLRRFGIEAQSVAPHRIRYVGELTADGQSVQGQWTIRLEVVARTTEGPHAIGGDGTWTARRVSDLPSEV